MTVLGYGRAAVIVPLDWAYWSVVPTMARVAGSRRSSSRSKPRRTQRLLASAATVSFSTARKRNKSQRQRFHERQLFRGGQLLSDTGIPICPNIQPIARLEANPCQLQRQAANS